MSVRISALVYRVVAVLTLVGAIAVGGLLAIRGRAPGSRRRPVRTSVAGARTIAVPGADGGAHPQPIATVIPPADAGPHWPPPLLNPGASLRMAWDLALGRPSAHEILFTFDDGPNPGTTDRLLGMLDRAHIHAVFFVCGWRLETEEPLRSRARALLRDEFARGHIIGNHTVHHRDMATLTAAQAQYEIDHNSDLIEEVIGEKPHLFRPPYGSYSEYVQRRVISRGDELMVWSIDSHDWQMVGNAQAVAMNVIRLIGNMAGGTVLLHDTHPWSVSAAQMIFRWLETENRERAAHGRALYTVMNPAEYVEGERARIPVVQAEMAAAAEAARHARRHGSGDDAGTPAMAGDAPPSGADGNSAGGAAPSTTAESNAHGVQGMGGGAP